MENNQKNCTWIFSVSLITFNTLLIFLFVYGKSVSERELENVRQCYFMQGAYYANPDLITPSERDKEVCEELGLSF